MTVDIAGLLSGAGNGRGFYLVDADTGAVVSAQVSESVHGEVRLTRKDKVQRVEQLATVVVSLDERE
jgi:hypothetical protein